ncbi:MAG: response regulator [Anaerolineae bacterium]|nr:response regulator [Anaerolineae bacterium]
MAKKRVLCIEDHPEMIELIRVILEREGFEVEGAVGGREGLRALHENPPDLLLLDLMMPGIDGFEVFRQMRADETLKNVPVIAVTAKAQSIDRVLILHIAGMDDYITKPFSPKELVASIARVMGGLPEVDEEPAGNAVAGDEERTRIGSPVGRDRGQVS